MILGDDIVPIDDTDTVRSPTYNNPFDDMPSYRPIMGFDMTSVSPYLSAFASGFGGGGGSGGGNQQQAAAAAAAQAEKERLQREKDAADARARTTLWAVVGIMGAGILGTVIYFVAKGRK